MPPVSAGVACGRHGDDASATRAIGARAEVTKALR